MASIGEASGARKERTEKETRIQFICQKCHQPLRLDPSFYQADAQAIQELSAPLLAAAGQIDNDSNDECFGGNSKQNINLARSGTEDDMAGVCVKTIPKVQRFASHVSTESGNGFAVVNGVDDSSGASDTMLSHRHMMLGELFDAVSSQSDIDHPLCEECTDTLLDSLDQQLRITEEECKEYRDFLDQLEKTESKEENLDDLKEELKQVQEEQAKAVEELAKLEEEETQVQKALDAEKEAIRKLSEEETRYWRDYAEHKQQLFDYEDEQRSVRNQLKYAQTQLEKLKRTNVFNATFHIWHNGHFGTINGFRLGSLPNIPVEWSEINAAWGQTVLLLHSLARKMNLTFERYRLVPFGNQSYVESLVDKKELPLYITGGYKFFWDTRFDQAMVAFLDCLQQFKEEIEKGDSDFSLPYGMDKGRIEEARGVNVTTYSIKIQFNSEEQWTKALKYMLTNLKWILTWVSAQAANR